MYLTNLEKAVTSSTSYGMVNEVVLRLLELAALGPAYVKRGRLAVSRTVDNRRRP